MTTTNGANTATVQTLTAEVRVLMVGSRQITMSVFKQLDHRPIEEIELFGRVSVPNDYGIVRVVGRSTLDGTLVRSHVDNPYGGLIGNQGNWDKAKALPLIVLAGPVLMIFSAVFSRHCTAPVVPVTAPPGDTVAVVADALAAVVTRLTATTPRTSRRFRCFENIMLPLPSCCRC